jgi:hypothetical protein
MFWRKAFCGKGRYYIRRATAWLSENGPVRASIGHVSHVLGRADGDEQCTSRISYQTCLPCDKLCCSSVSIARSLTAKYTERDDDVYPHREVIGRVSGEAT